MILHIGKITRSLSDEIQSSYPTAQLITDQIDFKNIKIGYSGIEEFQDEEKFLELLLSADEIFYYPQSVDSDFNMLMPTASSVGLTEYYLLLAKQHGVIIHNFTLQCINKIEQDYTNFLNLTDTRKNIPGPQLWCAGCSLTTGDGITTKQRYVTLLSQKLNLPLNLLAKGGSNIQWAADQLLRSDIKKNDIVVWGLTSKHRLTKIENGVVSYVLASSEPKLTTLTDKAISYLLINDDYITYHQLLSINQVINFCEKIGAKLLIVGLIPAINDHLYLTNLKYYYHYHYTNNRYVDIGTDQVHPGPLQHQKYATTIYQELIVRNLI